jgi:hypothetical protein
MQGRSIGSIDGYDRSTDTLVTWGVPGVDHGPIRTATGDCRSRRRRYEGSTVRLRPRRSVFTLDEGCVRRSSDVVILRMTPADTLVTGGVPPHLVPSTRRSDSLLTRGVVGPPLRAFTLERGWAGGPAGNVRVDWRVRVTLLKCVTRTRPATDEDGPAERKRSANAEIITLDRLPLDPDEIAAPRA